MINYEDPRFVIVPFGASDVIATSTGDGFVTGGEGQTDFPTEGQPLGSDALGDALRIRLLGPSRRCVGFGHDENRL